MIKVIGTWFAFFDSSKCCQILSTNCKISMCHLAFQSLILFHPGKRNSFTLLTENEKNSKQTHAVSRKLLQLISVAATEKNKINFR